MLREQEERAADAALGVAEVRYLRHPDGGLTVTPALEQELAALILECGPRRLVAHDPWSKGDGHPDHLHAGEAALAAMMAAGAPATGSRRSTSIEATSRTPPWT